MPALTCACGQVIPYGAIPCRDEWLFIADVDYDSFVGPVDAEDLYRRMRSFLRCPNCGRLWVFWNGYEQGAEEFVRVKGKPSEQAD